MDVMTFPVSLLSTSGLSTLLHGVISLLDATSYDKTMLAHSIGSDGRTFWAKHVTLFL